MNLMNLMNPNPTYVEFYCQLKSRTDLIPESTLIERPRERDGLFRGDPALRRFPGDVHLEVAIDRRTLPASPKLAGHVGLDRRHPGRLLRGAEHVHD